MIGQIVPSLRTTDPDGYIQCNGQTITRQDYPKFFETMGITGDTYTLPNLNVANGYSLGHAGTSTYSFRAHENGTNGTIGLATIQEHDHGNVRITDSERANMKPLDAAASNNATTGIIDNQHFTVSTVGGNGNDNAILVKYLIGVA